MVFEGLDILASIAAERGAVIVGSRPTRSFRTMRIRVRCQRHGPFLANIDRDGTGFRSWCSGCIREGSPHNARSKTRERLAAYVVVCGGLLLDERLERGQSYARILCNRHGLQRLSIRGALSKRRLWCARCKFDKLSRVLRKPYAEVERVVRERGWSLTTTEAEYRRASLVSVRCPNGHRSSRSVNSFRRGRGCRSCYARVGENAVRVVFEAIFRAEFPLRHPRWLKSSRGGTLELDGYSAKLKLAFEYQGFSHYRERNNFSENLCAVQRRDAEKASTCVARGVMLIHIDEMSQDVIYDPAAVFQHVAQTLIRYGIEAPPFDRLTIRSPRTVMGLERLRRAAKLLGLELLDDEYRGVDHHYKWRCKFCTETFSGCGYYRLVGRGCPLCWRVRRAEGTFWTSRKSRRVDVGE